MKTVTINKTYKAVKEILEAARSTAYRAVNFAMVQAYWNIGRVIVEEEQRGKATAGYGEYLIKELAERLTKEFGKGFTISNIKYFRQFYLSFSIGHAVRGQSQSSGKIVNALRSQSLPDKIHHALRDELPFVRPELSWTHYRLLLKVERPDFRKFYLDECIASNWSTRQLERQINSFYYERILSSRNKNIVRSEIKNLEPGPSPNDIIKAPMSLNSLVCRKAKNILRPTLSKA